MILGNRGEHLSALGVPQNGLSRPEHDCAAKSFIKRLTMGNEFVWALMEHGGLWVEKGIPSQCR